MTEDRTGNSKAAFKPCLFVFLAFVSFSFCLFMNDPACFLLMLEQRSLSLEDHTGLFVEIANLTHYPDYCLCTFYKTSLNDGGGARLSGDGPRGNFATFVEWVLVSCGLVLTVDIADDHTSPTSDPEPSPRLPCCAEPQPEPTADGEPDPTATNKPSPKRATELNIASESVTSDQLQEPATGHATVDDVREHEGLEESPAHCTTAEGELLLDSVDLIDSDLDLYVDMPILLPPSYELSVFPELSVCPVSAKEAIYELSVYPELFICPVATTEVVPLYAVLPVLGFTIWCVWAAHTIPENPGAHKFPPTLPLLPLPVIPAASAPPPLSPGSPSAHPQPTICAVGSPWVCQSPSASWLEDPLSPPPASESQTPPRPFDPSAPPWLLAPSSPPWPVSPPAPPGSSSLRLRLGLSLKNICIQKLRQLTCCLAALGGNDFEDSVFAQRHLTKLISDRLLR